VRGDRKRMRNVPESGWRTRSMPEQPPPDCSGIWYMCCVIFRWPGFPDRRPPGRRRSRHHLREHLLGGELVPVGAARVLADGGDKLAELVVAGDTELDPAGAAADVPG